MKTHEMWAGDVTKEWVRLTDGLKYTYEPYTLVGSVPISEGKVSVDTGGFTPGNYRVNPYSVWSETVEAGSLSLSESVVNGDYRYTTTYKGNQHIDILNLYMDRTIPAAFDGTADRALQKAYAKLARSSLSLGEDLGELTQTINMLRSPLRSLRKFLLTDGRKNLKSIRRLQTYLISGSFNGKKGREAVKAASDTWLEVRYGFRPLISTLGGLIDLATDRHGAAFNTNVIRSVKARASGNLVTEDETLDQMYTIHGAYQLYYEVLKQSRVRADASVQYLASKRGSTLDNLGLSPRMWPETAWDLTHLSFVVDWLFTVGPWIQSLRFKPEITVLGNTVSVKVDRTVSVKLTDISLYGLDHDPVRKRGEVTWTYNAFFRQAHRKLPILPTFTAGSTIDLFRSIDAAALLAQSLLSNLKRR